MSDPYGAIVTWVDRGVTEGPLDGLRVGVKDLIAVRGVPRLCGAAAMVDPEPQADDAIAVARLAAAGARIVATTATHEFGWGVITPGTSNPTAPDRIAGGSSGGSAAALAAGIVDGALGTDTAGSVRIPAACCGVVGLRPTTGAVPTAGVQPLAASFDTVGPMARDVTTTAALLSALLTAPLHPVSHDRLRIGVPAQVRDGPLDEEVRQTWLRALAALSDAGTAVVDVDVPRFDTAAAATATILAAEEAKVHAGTLARHGGRLSPGVREALERAARIPNDRVLEARRAAALFRDGLTGVFSAVDTLVLPVLPCRVPAVGRRGVDVAGEEQPTAAALLQLNAPWSLGGVPAGAVPVASDSGGAPIAMQVVGPWRSEAVVLGVMALLEQVAGGPRPPVSPGR